MIVEKRCTQCRKLLDVDTESLTVQCTKCGIIHDIFRPTTKYEKANNKGGIALKYVPPEKTCSRCKETKTIEQFKKYTHSSDLHFYWCKDCTNAQSRLVYKQKNKHKISDIREIPQVRAKSPLSSVLPYLISVSKTGYHADRILGESLKQIKETITEASEA